MIRSFPTANYSYIRTQFWLGQLERGINPLNLTYLSKSELGGLCHYSSLKENKMVKRLVSLFPHVIARWKAKAFGNRRVKTIFPFLYSPDWYWTWHGCSFPSHHQWSSMTVTSSWTLRSIKVSSLWKSSLACLTHAKLQPKRRKKAPFFKKPFLVWRQFLLARMTRQVATHRLILN